MQFQPRNHVFERKWVIFFSLLNFDLLHLSTCECAPPAFLPHGLFVSDEAFVLAWVFWFGFFF